MHAGTRVMTRAHVLSLPVPVGMHARRCSGRVSRTPSPPRASPFTSDAFLVRARARAIQACSISFALPGNTSIAHDKEGGESGGAGSGMGDAERESEQCGGGACDDPACAPLSSAQRREVDGVGGGGAVAHFSVSLGDPWWRRSLRQSDAREGRGGRGW